MWQLAVDACHLTLQQFNSRRSKWILRDISKWSKQKIEIETIWKHSSKPTSNRMKEKRNCGLRMHGVVCTWCVCTHSCIKWYGVGALPWHFHSWYSTEQRKSNLIMIKNRDVALWVCAPEPTHCMHRPRSWLCRPSISHWTAFHSAHYYYPHSNDD